MSRETKVAQIPDVRDDNVTEVLRAVKNVLQVREGHIGDELDQNVTLRDLKDIGIVQGGGFTLLSNGSKVPVLITGKLPDGYDPATDYTIPPAPTGLTATGGFSNVYLSWNGAPYRNPAYTEIWRASVDNLSSAIRIGTTATNVYADAALEGATYYYWIRFVSVADVTGPYNGTAGTPATTATNPGPVLDLLSGQIRESQLYSTLGARINLIDAAPTVANSVAWRVAQEAAARSTAIQNEASTRAQDLLTEASTRATADSALQTQINTIVAAGSSDTATIIAALQTEQTARISADAAEVTARETLASQVRGNYTGTDIGQVTTGLIYNERQARTTADTALSTSISALSSTVTNNYNTLNSAITTEQSTRASADTALSSSITNLTATVNNNYSTLNGNINTVSAAVTTEASARASADTALSSQVSALSSTVSGNLSTVNAAIATEASTRASADTALSTSVTNLSSSVDALQNTATGFDTGLSWNFDSTVEGWSSIGSTLSWSSGSIRLNSSGSDPVLSSPSFSLAGAANHIIRARVMRLAGSSWQGDVYYTTASHSHSESYKKKIADTTVLNAWRVLEWDMSALTAGGSDWTSSTITNIRFDLGGTSSDQFLVDWVTIGRVAPTSYTAAIQQEATTRATADSALSTQITTLSSTVTGNYNTLNAAIQTEQTTRANADSAFSSSISTLQASVNNNTIAIQNEQSVRAAADNSLYAQYTVKIDNNGHVSGFGLASTSSNAGPTSAFIVRADRFAIAGPNDTTDPLGTTAPTRLPFIVTTTPTTINGRTYPSGAWIDTAFIANATIGSAQIGSLVADKITTGNLTAAIGVTTGYIAGGVTPGAYPPGHPLYGTGFFLGLDSSVFKFYVGSYSKNILWDGSNLAIKGTISAANATFQGLTITDNAGNIILSSGGIPASVVSGLGSLATASSVSTSQVTGLGSLATQNSVTTGQVNGLGALATQNTVSSGQVTGLGTLATQNTVSTGQVTGLGGLATQNSVFFGSTVKFPDGSTANTSDFVSRLSQITASNVSTFIASAAIGEAYIGNLSASKITSGFISADRIQAGTIDTKILNIDAATIGTGTIANARIGDLSAKKIYCGTTSNAVDFVDPGQTSIPLNSTASGWFSYTGDTAAATYVSATCFDGENFYDCSYYTYGPAPVTSTQVQFVCGDINVPRARRVRSGLVRFHVMGSATVDHYFSLWARGGTVANPGAWFPLVVAIEPQRDYGATSTSCYFEVEMVYGQMIQFAMHATDLNGNYWNGNQGRELRYSNLTVFGVNF